MITFRIKLMRLLFGASLVFTSITLSREISESTFLFCLKPNEKPLHIQRADNFFKIDNADLDQILHDIDHDDRLCGTYEAKTNSHICCNASFTEFCFNTSRKNYLKALIRMRLCFSTSGIPRMHLLE